MAAILVEDDIADGATLRRYKPAYYILPDVGMIAINDAVMLESSAYFLLRTFIGREPYYLDVLNNFHETALQIWGGQMLDLISGPLPHRRNEGVDFSKFTVER